MRAFFLSAGGSRRIGERDVNNKPPLPCLLVLLMGESEKLRLAGDSRRQHASRTLRCMEIRSGTRRE
jgi:hypothetical protein